jgi:hypothetical protein
MPLSRKRRLPLLRESEATGRTLEIYQEIKDALGVPHVNLFYQAYGVYPRFLELHWKLMRPAIQTREFFRFSQRLGAEAYTRVHNYFSVPDLGERMAEAKIGEAAQQELLQVVELFHYNNPLLLLIAAAQFQAFEDGPSVKRASSSAPEHPVYSQAPAKVAEEGAPPGIRKIYEDIKRTLGLSFINTDYQAFAHFPEFFSFYWFSVKQFATSPLNGENRHALRESAAALATELPNAPQLTVEQMHEAGLTSEEIGAAIHVTEEFLNLLSGLVLNVAFAKISLEGGTQPRAAAEKAKKDRKPEAAA